MREPRVGDWCRAIVQITMKHGRHLMKQPTIDVGRVVEIVGSEIVVESAEAWTNPECNLPTPSKLWDGQWRHDHEDSDRHESCDACEAWRQACLVVLGG